MEPLSQSSTPFSFLTIDMNINQFFIIYHKKCKINPYKDYTLTQYFIYKFTIKFPIQQHKIESNEDLVIKTIDTISNYIKTRNWELDNKHYLWLWRTLYQLKYKPMSYIKYEDYKQKM